MAKAFKCDVCGDMYTPYGSWEKPNKMMLLYYASSVKTFDCCPACMATLKETINMLGDNKHESD